jgi:Fe-S cluster biosynthesis and repair protein YggX
MKKINNKIIKRKEERYYRHFTVFFNEKKLFY